MSFQELPFLDVFKDASAGNIKTPQTEFLEEGEIPVVDQGQRLVAGFVNDRSRICKAKPPVIVFGDHTRALKYVDFEFAMGADGTKVLVPKVESDTKYLYYALTAMEIPAAGYSRHYKLLKETKIPLPPLAEQKRIAGILDAADALRAKRREALAELDTLLQSTFLDMFGDPVTNPRGWEVRELGEVAGFHAGSTLPAGEDFVGQDGGFLYLKVGDLNHILNKEAVVRSNIWGKEAKKGITAPKDAVVIPKRGGAIGTNKKRLLSRKSVLDPNLMAISGSESLHHVYLHRWFHTFDLMSITSGSTVPQLNKRDLAPLRIPLPPVDLQHHFAAIVESVERQKTSQRAHLAELDTLFASLQSRAFRGDL